MATIHISEVEAARDFAGLLAKVRMGTEVIIDGGDRQSVVIHTTSVSRRTLREALALLQTSSTIVDDGFAHDVQAAQDHFNRTPIADPWE